MKNLRDVNVDNNMVGWYQSTYLGSFLSDAVFVETQLSYQENLSEFVVIVYGMLLKEDVLPVEYGCSPAGCCLLPRPYFRSIAEAFLLFARFSHRPVRVGPGCFVSAGVSHDQGVLAAPQAAGRLLPRQVCP